MNQWQIQRLLTRVLKARRWKTGQLGALVKEALLGRWRWELTTVQEDERDKF